jgi:hypothetical protein
VRTEEANWWDDIQRVRIQRGKLLIYSWPRMRLAIPFPEIKFYTINNYNLNTHSWRKDKDVGASVRKKQKKKNQIESLFDDCALAARAEPCTFIQRQLCPNFISS